MEYNGMKLFGAQHLHHRPAGKIAKVFMKVKPAGHSEEVLAALAELQKKS